MEGFKNLLDMFDGGGMGQAGPKFEDGGLLSHIANMLGIRPHGYRDRLQQPDLSARGPEPSYPSYGPPGTGPAPAAPAPAPFQPQITPVPPVETYPLTGGRGTYGMPTPPSDEAEELARQTIEYLRASGYPV